MAAGRLDFRDLIPESWLCIDCNMNTAPGLLNRVEMENAARELGVVWETGEGIPQTIGLDAEIYTVREAVWKKAGMETKGGCLCIGCIRLQSRHRREAGSRSENFFRPHTRPLASVLYERDEAHKRIAEHWRGEWGEGDRAAMRKINTIVDFVKGLPHGDALDKVLAARTEDRRVGVASKRWVGRFTNAEMSTAYRLGNSPRKARTMTYEQVCEWAQRMNVHMDKPRGDAILRQGSGWHVPTTDKTEFVHNWEEFRAAGGIACFSEDQSVVALTLPEHYKFSIKFQSKSDLFPGTPD